MQASDGAYPLPHEAWRRGPRVQTVRYRAPAMSLLSKRPQWVRGHRGAGMAVPGHINAVTFSLDICLSPARDVQFTVVGPASETASETAGDSRRTCSPCQAASGASKLLQKRLFVKNRSWACWCTPAIPTLMRLRQKDDRFGIPVLSLTQ